MSSPDPERVRADLKVIGRAWAASELPPGFPMQTVDAVFQAWLAGSSPDYEAAAERNSRIIAVTGGRDYKNLRVVIDALKTQIHKAETDGLRPVLLTGGCPTGADELARDWWHRQERPYVVDPARFAMNGRSAGPTRNNRMAIGSTFAMDPPLHPDVLIRFPGGRGTRDCEKKMRSMGVPVVEVSQ